MIRGLLPILLFAIGQQAYGNPCPQEETKVLIADFKSGWWAGDGDDLHLQLLTRIVEDCATISVEYHLAAVGWGFSAYYPERPGFQNGTEFDRDNFPFDPVGTYDQVWILSGSNDDSSDIPTSDELVTTFAEDIAASSASVFIGTGIGNYDHGAVVAEDLGIGSVFDSHYTSIFYPSPRSDYLLPDALSVGNGLVEHPLFAGVDELADDLKCPTRDERIQTDYLVNLPQDALVIATNARQEETIAVIEGDRRVVLDAGLSRTYAVAIEGGHAGTYRYIQNLFHYLSEDGGDPDPTPVRERWSFQTDDFNFSQAKAVRGGFVVTQSNYDTDECLVTKFSHAGVQVWQHRIDEDACAFNLQANADGRYAMVYVPRTADIGKIYLFDVFTGDLRWTRRMTDVGGKPIIIGDVVLYRKYQSDRFVSYDIATGDTVTSFDLAEFRLSYTPDPEVVYGVKTVEIDGLLTGYIARYHENGGRLVEEWRSPALPGLIIRRGYGFVQEIGDKVIVSSRFHRPDLPDNDLQTYRNGIRFGLDRDSGAIEWMKRSEGTETVSYSSQVSFGTNTDFFLTEVRIRIGDEYRNHLEVRRVSDGEVARVVQPPLGSFIVERFVGNYLTFQDPESLVVIDVFGDQSVETHRLGFDSVRVYPLSDTSAFVIKKNAPSRGTNAVGYWEF